MLNLVIMDRKGIGNCAEDLAMSYMLSIGCKLVARNWRCGHKEIDLVFEDDACLRIVEVRCRTYNALVPPAATIGNAKKLNIMRAADAFARYSGCDKSVVFDVVCIVYDGKRFGLEYLPDAFTRSW